MANAPTPDNDRGTPFTVEPAPAPAGAVGLRLEGELDLQGVDALEAAVAGLPHAARVVVDLRGLAFMDSSGVAALIRADQRLREQGGAVRCLVPSEGPVRKVVDLTQLGELLEVDEAPPAAAGFGPGSRVDAGGGG